MTIRLKLAKRLKMRKLGRRAITSQKVTWALVFAVIRNATAPSTIQMKGSTTKVKSP